MTQINNLFDYEFLSGIYVSNDDNKIAYKKTQANLKDNKYDTDLYLYEKDLGKSYRLTDKKSASLCSFDGNSNLIYKYDSDDCYDYFYKNDGYGLGELAFKIDKDVKSLKWLKDDTYLLSASPKKSEEEKKSEKENEAYEEVTTLPFWLNGAGYLKEETVYYYLYDLKANKLTEILKSDKDNEVSGLDISEDLGKIAYVRSHSDANDVMEFRESIILKDLKTEEEKILVDKGYATYTLHFIEDRLIFVGTDMKKGGINEDAFIYEVDFDGKSFELDAVASLSAPLKSGLMLSNLSNKSIYYPVDSIFISFLVGFGSQDCATLQKHSSFKLVANTFFGKL